MAGGLNRAEGRVWTGWGPQDRGASETVAERMTVEEHSSHLILYPEDPRDVKKAVLFGSS